MDFMTILKEFGLPVVGVFALGWYVKSQNAWIQNELQTELRESFTRVENIIIKLIDAQKTMQMNQKEIMASYRAIVEILASLSGNGLKDKFLRRKNDEGW
jgi:K+-transporting ATPase A subunit